MNNYHVSVNIYTRIEFRTAGKDASPRCLHVGSCCCTDYLYLSTTVRFAQRDKYHRLMSELNTSWTINIVNIHSHLWGAILFIYFLATYRQSHVQIYPGATWKDTAVFAVFLSSAVFCLSASAFFHTSTCHSEKVRSTRGIWPLTYPISLLSRSRRVVTHWTILE